jgi:hypothetical protein
MARKFASGPQPEWLRFIDDESGGIGTLIRCGDPGVARLYSGCPASGADTLLCMRGPSSPLRRERGLARLRPRPVRHLILLSTHAERPEGSLGFPGKVGATSEMFLLCRYGMGSQCSDTGGDACS